LIGSDSTELSRADLRSALRALPRQRRRSLARAVRAGRAVEDPQDAALAVGWARRAQATPWPRWVLPRTRPRGRRALLWLLHAGWILLAIGIGVVLPIWRSGGMLRWVMVGVLAYSILTLPWVFALILRLRWNAPETERRNRELLDQTAER
jgi:hypothetical protein